MDVGWNTLLLLLAPVSGSLQEVNELEITQEYRQTRPLPLSPLMPLLLLWIIRCNLRFLAIT